MDLWLRLTTETAALHWILLDARTAHSDREAQILRYRVRTLGLSDADTAVCLGILADVVGEEVAA